MKSKVMSDEQLKIIDNCLPSYLFQTLSNSLLHPDVAWYHCSTAYDETVDLFGYSFHHTILFDGKPNSGLCQFVEPLIKSLIYQNEDKLDSLVRIRVGMITVTHKSYVHKPHIDFDEYPHKTGLLYINESDGDTIFYENKYDPAVGVSSVDFIRDPKVKVKVKTRIAPEPNKLVIFDGRQYHSSSTPTKTPRRLVLNFNYTVKN